jgi:nucleotide-binding universal stress UspA family protein
MYRTIVVGTDGSPTAAAAVRHAYELAQLTGGAMHVVSVLKLSSAAVGAPEFGVTGVDTLSAASEVAAAALEQAIDDARRTGMEVVTHNPVGDPAVCLLDVARDVNADLIVVGSVGMQRRLFGSTPNTVAHKAPCHVLVVHTSD